MTHRSLAVAFLVGSIAAAGAQAPPSNLDHYLCYRVKSSAFAPVERMLHDQLQPSASFDLKQITRLCTPAEKNALPMVHPTVHQVAYRIRARKGTPRFAKTTHVTLDQFGTRNVTVVRPDGLLVPSTKVLGPGGAPPYTGGTSVDHYKCYRTKGEKHFVAPPAPTVRDQFLPNGQLLVVKGVTRLCTPVDKNGEDATAPTHPGHLVCYRVRLPAGVSFSRVTASTNNQIRPERLDVLRPAELCLPALKDPQATTTSVTTTTVTSTTSTTAAPCGSPGSAPAPVCWGACPPATPICADVSGTCTCIAGSTPCGSASFPQCDGACPPTEACASSPSGGCSCTVHGIPCGASGFPSCNGACDPGDDCVPVSTPDGDGCICVPEGSTCYQTYPACGGTCPPGQNCVQYGIPGLCRCE